jgi:hypothetical protein
MTDDPIPSIAALAADEIERRLAELGALLHACVLDGASVGFVVPFATEAAQAFWRLKVLPSVRARGAVLFAAEVRGRIVGTVLLDHDTPPNQPHRAEVRKMLVHPDCRRRGIAKALMSALERRAGELGRSLLTLDTRTGDAAEPLYAALGYRTAGVIPFFCRDTLSDRLDSTTIMWKRL